MATGLGEGNSQFKPVKLRLKNDLVSYPVHAEGSDKYKNWNYTRVIFEIASHKTAAVRPHTSYHKNHPSEMNKILLDNAEEVKTHSEATPVITDQQKLTLISSVRVLTVMNDRD